MYDYATSGFSTAQRVNVHAIIFLLIVFEECVELFILLNIIATGSTLLLLLNFSSFLNLILYSFTLHFLYIQ